VSTACVVVAEVHAAARTDVVGRAIAMPRLFIEPRKSARRALRHPAHIARSLGRLCERRSGNMARQSSRVALDGDGSAAHPNALFRCVRAVLIVGH
jgi:hypothetical protein